MTKVKETRIIRSLRKTLTMQVLPDATLVVKTPFHLSKLEIEAFIEKNQPWITRQLKNLTDLPVTIKQKYVDSEKLLYLGKLITLKVGNYKAIAIQEDELLFPEFLLFRIEKEITNWYIKQAQSLIAYQVESYAKQINTQYSGITFSDTSSKWGSCTPDNRLQFNWRLIMAPVLVINYVVVHELVHTIEKNHSARFWSKVRNFNPSYKQQIRWLKMHQNALIT